MISLITHFQLKKNESKTKRIMAELEFRNTLDLHVQQTDSTVM